jgi:hypothetical protein
LTRSASALFVGSPLNADVGRRDRPTGRDYRVTAVFADSPDKAAGLQHANEHLSIWLRFLAGPPELEPTPVEIDFFHKEGLPPLTPGLRFMAMEGHRVVAEGIFDRVVDHVST